jgi:hypothetical protein
VTPTKEQDLARLAEIADELESLDLLYHERSVILDRRVHAGDCGRPGHPRDKGYSTLAGVARIARGQVIEAVEPARVEKARRAIANAKKSKNAGSVKQ